MKSAALHNLGCKVNGYELDVMQQMLQEKGYKIVPFDEPADIYIVNTCTVTNIADRKSRQMLHRARKRNPEAIVVAVGCYVQTGREELLKDAGVDLAVGNNRKKQLPAILEEYMRRKDARASGSDSQASQSDSQPSGSDSQASQNDAKASQNDTWDKTLGGTTVPDMTKETAYEDLFLETTAERTRASIKIQDGCNQFCSYCIIPYARGRVRSRVAEDIIKEVKGLSARGYKEVVLTGIHISSYGTDFEDKEAQGRALLSLIRRIGEVKGIERIRLGSLEPRVITEEFVRGLRETGAVCPHFHLSLQSGCDATLKRMNRHYTSGEYLEKTELLRQMFDHPAITTDVIAGFPGETQEEFAATCDFLERVRFYEMHVFKYSRRDGTPAAVMEGQVPEALKAERSAVLLTVARKHSMEYRARYIDKEVKVLVEETQRVNGKVYQVGHTDSYVKVAMRTGQTLSNQMVAGRVAGFLTDEILWMKNPEETGLTGAYRKAPSKHGDGINR